MTHALALALAAVLIISVSNVAVWAVTRIRAHRAGYRKAYAEQDILVDDLQAEIRDLEQRNAELSRQQRRAAA
jgi:hypothetical protein